MKTHRRLSFTAGFLATGLFLVLLSYSQTNDPWSKRFRHHFITPDIPQEKNLTWGYGTPVLADFDKDGDLDFAFSTREERLYWFENQKSGSWIQHEAGQAPIGQLGATALDVDRDGWTDIVIGGMWYHNPGNPRKQPFERYEYDNRIREEIHDLVPADINNDKKPDIVAMGDEEGCFWYQIPENPCRNSEWKRTVITMTVLDNQEDIHGGFAPNGTGDLDKDGDVDLVLPDRWLENRDGGMRWVSHPLPFGKRGPYGLSCRGWVVDLDKDGDLDIVASDSDQKESRVAWLESDGNHSPQFKAHFLPLTAPGRRGSFHALAVADFDQDSDLDILSVEQEDPDILPSGAAPRWYIWENMDGFGREFVERVILDARLGGHDVWIGDIDGDGDIDISSKIWSRWSGNANGGRFHADWMENLNRP